MGQQIKRVCMLLYLIAVISSTIPTDLCCLSVHPSHVPQRPRSVTGGPEVGGRHKTVLVTKFISHTYMYGIVEES